MCSGRGWVKSCLFNQSHSFRIKIKDRDVLNFFHNASFCSCHVQGVRERGSARQRIRRGERVKIFFFFFFFAYVFNQWPVTKRNLKTNLQNLQQPEAATGGAPQKKVLLKAY